MNTINSDIFALPDTAEEMVAAKPILASKLGSIARAVHQLEGVQQELLLLPADTPLYLRESDGEDGAMYCLMIDVVGNEAQCRKVFEALGLKTMLDRATPVQVDDLPGLGISSCPSDSESPLRNLFDLLAPLYGEFPVIETTVGNLASDLTAFAKLPSPVLPDRECLEELLGLVGEFLCDQETLRISIRNEALCEKARHLLDRHRAESHSSMPPETVCIR